MKSITKRDIKIFLLGMLTMIVIEIVYDWDGTVGEFIRGFNEGKNRELRQTK